MAKKIQAYVKLQINAGEADPNTPLGPALGQHGVNVMEFCKAFNVETRRIEKGLPIPVVIILYTDHSFNFVIEDTVQARFNDEIVRASAIASTTINGETVVVTFNASTATDSQAAVDAFLTGTSSDQPPVLQQGINVLPNGHQIWSGMIAGSVMLHLEISGSVVYSREVPFVPVATPKLPSSVAGGQAA